MKALSRLLILFIVGLVAACGTAPTATPLPTAIPPTVPPTRTAIPIPVLPTAADLRPQDATNIVTVRFLNATQPSVDVLFDGNLVSGDLAFASPTNTIQIRPGDYRVRVVPGGAGRDISKVLLDQKVTLKSEESVVLVFSAAVGAANTLQLSIFTNNLKEIRKGTARLTFGHALSARGGLTISENDKTVASVSNIGDAQEAQEISLGAHKFDFAQSGGAQFSLPLTLIELRAYLLIVIGDATNPQAVVISDGAEREIQFRFVNASLSYNSDKQPLDIYVDSRQVADDLAYGKVTDFIRLPARFYSFKVLKATDKADAKPLFELRHEPDTDTTTFVVFDNKDGLGIAVVPEDLTPTNPNFARVVFVNAIPNTAGLRLVRAGVLDTQIRAIPFGEASPSTLMIAGPAAFAFRTDSADNPLVVENKQALALKEGTAYVYIAGASTSREALMLSIEVGTQTVPGVTAAPNTQMQVRFLNGLSDGTAATVQLGGRNIFSNIQAARLSTPFLVTPQDIELTLINAKDNKPLRATRLQPSQRKTMLLVALGTVGSPRFLQMGSDTPLTTSSIWLQVIHAGTGMLPLRVEFTPRQTATVTPLSGSSIDRGTSIPQTPARIQGQLIAPRLEFGQSITDFPLPAGSYTLYAYDASSGKLAGTLDLDTSGGHRYDVLILPAASGKATLNLYTTEDLPQPQ